MLVKHRIGWIAATLALGAAIIAPPSAGADAAHVVSSGESLSSIATADGLSVARLAAANGLSPEAELVTGRILKIPPQSVAGRQSPTTAEPSAVSSPTTSGAGYRVRPGDTLSGIAARYGVTVNRLAAANGLRADGLLLAGRRLTIPGAAATSDAPSPSPTGVGAQPTGDTVAPSDVGAVAAPTTWRRRWPRRLPTRRAGSTTMRCHRTGATGVMQIEPGTWRYIRSQLGAPTVARFGHDNVVAGVMLLHSLLAQTGGDARLAAAGYYQGLGSVREHGMYRDTRRYVTRCDVRCGRASAAPERGPSADRPPLCSLSACSTTTTLTSTSSTARPSRSSATAPRATPTPSTSRTPASTSSSACAPARRASPRRKAHGLRVAEPADAASEGDIVMLLAPDELHGQIWEGGLKDGIAPGNVLMFGHGFSIHYGEIVPPPDVDVALVAPKGPGHLVRRQYTEGSGVPCLVAVQQDASGDALGIALAYAKGIGGTRGGVIETTFKDETETDLFGEQAVLCGGVTELVRAGYETLTEAGYDERLAYFEVLHELKLIVDLMYEKGISGMRYSISNTAEYGDMTRGNRIIGDGDPRGDEAGPGRDPVRRLRPRVDRREPRRPGELQADALRAGRPSGRARRQGAARADGLDRHRVRSRADAGTS